MDKRLWPLASRISVVEHFAVDLYYAKDIGEGVVNPGEYDYVNQSSNTYTVKRWVENRLIKKIPYLTGNIYSKKGGILDNNNGIGSAKGIIQIVWCEPLEIIFFAKDRNKLEVILPLLQDLNPNLKPVDNKFLWKWYFSIVTPPVILYGFEYHKILFHLNQVSISNGIKFKMHRKEKDENDFFANKIDEYIVYDDILRILKKHVNTVIEKI